VQENTTEEERERDKERERARESERDSARARKMKRERRARARERVRARQRARARERVSGREFGRPVRRRLAQRTAGSAGQLQEGRGAQGAAAAGAAKDKKARKSPAPAAADGVDPDYGLLKEYIAEWVASGRAKLLAPTEEEARAIEDLKQKRLGAANGTEGANGGHIETDHGLVDALWQKCKEHLPEELAYYLDVELTMLKERYVSDPKGFGKFLRSLHSSNRLAASGTSSIGIERMFHTAEHLAKMDEFLEKVKQLDPSFADLPVLVFERALLWGALRYRAWPDALTEAIVKVAACYYGLLLAINVMSGGYATMQTERLYARYFQQSEKLRRLHAGKLFEAQGGRLSAALGAHALVLEVANAPGEEGGSGHYRFHTRTELILAIAKLRVQAPNVSAADLADGAWRTPKPLSTPSRGRRHAVARTLECST
jgi:hypothetical protein